MTELLIIKTASASKLKNFLAKNQPQLSKDFDFIFWNVLSDF